MRTVVVGIGNPDCGDDAIGRLIAQTLRGRLPDVIPIKEADGEPAVLIAQIEREDCAYLIDSCSSGAVPGTLHRFDASCAPLPARRFGFSTHSMGLADTLELARALGALPERCIVYAVEGISFAAGTPVSLAVAQVLPQVKDQICREITEALGVG